jgi:hypothetical protein
LRANSTSGGVTPTTPSEWHSLIRRSMVSLENLLKVRESSSISSFVVHWANRANKPDYYLTHPYAPSSVLVLDARPFLLFIELYIIPKKKTKKKLTPPPHARNPKKPKRKKKLPRPSQRQWDCASNWHIRSRVAPSPGTPWTPLRSGINCR